MNQNISDFIAYFEKIHNCTLDREITDETEYDIFYMKNCKRFNGKEIKIKFFVFEKMKNHENIYVCLRLY